MRDVVLALAALALVGCRQPDVPTLSPATVTEGEVVATALAITGQAPEAFLVAANDHLMLASDYVATIGDAATTVVAADGHGVTVRLDHELPPGRYPLELTARGDHWLVDDALEVVPVDAVLVDAPLGAMGCDPADSSLVACYPFENDASDRSLHHLDGLASGGIAYSAGTSGSAIVLSAGQVDVPDAPVMNVTQVTMEAWVRPAALPVGSKRAAIVDSDLRFGMFVRPGGDLSCATSVAVTAAAGISVGAWTHVACTYDGAELRMFVNGVQVTAAAGGGPIGIGTKGMTIGANNPGTAADPFTGSLDDVRIYSVARTPLEVCGDAQRASCP